MDPKALLKKIRRIEIRTSHIVNDVLAGHYHSAFKGLGMEFEEVRQYQAGDDVRTIDWNVSARYGEPYVKMFREERELTVMLLVDMSRSLEFGTVEQFKREYLAELCATLAFSAIKNNDKVGLIGFTDQVEQFVPPRKGPRHVLRVIRELLAHRPEDRGTDLRVALDHLNRIIRRRAVVFVVSDFQDDGFFSALTTTCQRHDVIPVRIADRHERDLPNIGLVEFIDPETGERRMVDTSSRAWRRKFARQAERFFARQDRELRRLRLDCIDVRTGESFVEPLTRFFRAREVRG